MDNQNNQAIYRTREEWEARVHRSGINKEISKERCEALTKSGNTCAVECYNGTFVGLRSFNDQTDEVFSWKGIPYAHQPIGERRFKKAELQYDSLDKKSSTIYEAFYYGKSSLQPVDASEASSMYMQGDDCLTLAIYRYKEPYKNPSKKACPVLVYIHGGGWSYGSTSEPIYDGTNFVYNNPDIIVVCVTYRLGLMGQINLSKYDENDEYEYSTNNGLLDQRCALQWIHDNISGFGGDPNNVTICGESAGGGSVSLQCCLGRFALDNEGVELFHKAIAMSGGVNQVTTGEDSEMLTEKLMNDLGISTIPQLQDISFEELAAWWQNNHLLMNYPILDGKVLPDNVDALYKKFSSPKVREIPMIQGATTNEFAYYRTALGDEGYEKVCSKVLELVTIDALDDLKAYFNSIKKLRGCNDKEIIHDLNLYKYDLANDYALQGVNYRQLEYMGNTEKTYAYAFDIPYDGDNGLYSLYKGLGAAHGVDCFYLFGNFDGRKCHGSRGAVHCSKNFQRYISNFCKIGRPDGDVDWGFYTGNGNNILLLTQDKAAYHFHMTNDFSARITTYNALVDKCPALRSLKSWPYFLG